MQRGGGAQASRKLLAALAVMAVAFVVLAAVPSVATDSDADATTPVYKDGIIAAGNIHDKSTADQIISALSGKTITDSAVDTVFIIYKATVSEEEVKAIVSGTVEGKAFGGDDSGTIVCKDGVNVVYWTVGGDGTKAGQVTGFTDASKPAEVTLKVGNTTYDKITIDAGSVTLYQDVTSSIDYTVTVNGDVTLDLNDHELKLTQTGIRTSGKAVYGLSTFAVSKDSSLTIVGADRSKSELTIDGYTSNYGVVSSVISATTNAKVTMRNVDYSTNGAAFFPYGDAAEVNIDNSDVTAPAYAVGTNNAITNGKKVTINVTNESVLTTTDKDSATVMINVGDAELKIENSTLNGKRQVLFVRAGIATVTGTTINFDDTYDGSDGKNMTSWRDGNNVTSGAVVVGNMTSSAYKGLASLIMIGGSINAVCGNAVVTTVASDDDHSVNVIIGQNSPTTISCGPEGSAASIVVSDLKYSATSTKNPTTPLMISTGSVELGGTLDEVKIVEGEATVSSDLTIADGGKLVLAEGATVTVKKGAKIVLNDTDDLVVDENAKLVLDKDAEIEQGGKTVYIPGTVILFGSTEYVVNVAVFDETYTVYYGVATQPIAYTGKEIKDSDVVGSARFLQCIKDDGTEISAVDVAITDIVIEDSVSGKILAPDVYPDAVTYMTTIAITDGKSSSYVTRTDAALLVTKADLSKATATIETLTYDGTNQTPEYSLAFNGEAVDDIAVKYYPDKSCTTEVMVCEAGTYYAKFVATADNELFAGEKVVEFKVEKAASGAFEYDVSKSDGNADYYWTAHAYDGNIVVTINDASGTYKVYTATTLKADGTPDYGSAETFTDQDKFDLEVENIDYLQTKAYTLYLKVEVSGASNYADETIVLKPIPVGDVAFRIDYTSSVVNGTITGPNYCQDGKRVVLTVTPDKGCKLQGAITINYVLDGVTKNENVVDNEFVMPAADVEIKAYFEQQYTVEFADGVDVEAEKTGEVVSKETYVDAGERITVSVPAGMRFDGAPVVTYMEGTEQKTCPTTHADGTYTFVMPAADVEITFELVGDLKVVLVEDGYKKLVFEGLADGEMFDLPFPADHDFWTVGEDAEKYNGGSIYVVDKDHAEDGVITFTATDYEPIIEEEYVTINFVYGLNGEHSYSLEVVKDEVIGIFPAAAAIDGYALSWAFGGAPVSETTVATEDMIIVASYVAIPPVESGEKIVKVTFSYDGKTTIVEIKKGTAVGMTPADAVKDGYVLKWMVGEVEFNEKDQISEDTVVTAVYTLIDVPEIQYSTNMVVALKVVGGNVYYTIVALDGKVVPAGTLTITYGYILDLGEFGTAIDFKTIVVDITNDENKSTVIGSVNLPAGAVSISAEFAYTNNGVVLTESTPKYIIEAMQ